MPSRVDADGVPPSRFLQERDGHSYSSSRKRAGAHDLRMCPAQERGRWTRRRRGLTRRRSLPRGEAGNPAHCPDEFPVARRKRGADAAIPVAGLHPQALPTIFIEAADEADATSRAGLPGMSQKIQKSSESLLTVRRGPDYIRLTNDSGHAADDEELRSKEKLRVS